MRNRVLIFAILCNSLTGCYKNHLYVQQEWVDREWLASSHVKTPDPRQGCPPEGQRLLISWDFPRSIFRTDLTLIATVRFWDNTQKEFVHPMDRRRDFTTYFFPVANPDQRILTYRIQIVNGEGTLIETWNHHFWTELIDVDRSKSSVSSQPMQGSVIETP
ncbi:MAG TPA: hypothetical protein VLE89_05765 [Chlamydiales bacterium]|nr:hypothetical protein [Chlamydiales bacterium]